MKTSTRITETLVKRCLVPCLTLTVMLAMSATPAAAYDNPQDQGANEKEQILISPTKDALGGSEGKSKFIRDSRTLPAVNNTTIHMIAGKTPPPSSFSKPGDKTESIRRA